jgi:hypothetical protein
MRSVPGMLEALWKDVRWMVNWQLGGLVIRCQTRRGLKSIQQLVELLNIPANVNLVNLL